MPDINSQFDRLPPHSIEAEKCLLASMMLLGNDKASFAEVSSILDREAFYQADHQIIFDTLIQLHAGKQPIDGVTVRESLIRRGLFEEVGGMEYLANIFNTVPSAAHYAHYAKIVAGKAKWRGLISLSNDALRAAYAPHDAVDDTEAADTALSKFASSASMLAAGGKAGAIHHVRDVIPEILAMRHQGDVLRHKTGLTQLDALIGGMGFGLKHIVGALQYMGKSAFLKNLSLRLAASGLPVGIISVEEDRQKIVANMLSSESGIANNRIQFATAGAEEWDAIESAAVGLANMPIHIVDSARKLTAVIAMAHLLASKHGCRAIFVDHDHIIDGGRDKNQSREQEVSKISADLKWTWRELNVIGVEACQLNRAVGKERPTMANLRDSGTLAQDADVVMLLHREDYHNRETPGYRKDHILEVIVDKNKAGASATIPLYYDEARYMICDQENGRPVFPKSSPMMPEIDHDMLTGAFQ